MAHVYDDDEAASADLDVAIVRSLQDMEMLDAHHHNLNHNPKVDNSSADLDVAIARSLQDMKMLDAHHHNPNHNPNPIVDNANTNPPSQYELEERVRDEREKRAYAIDSEEEAELQRETEFAAKVNEAFASGLPTEIPLSFLKLWTKDFETKLGSGGFGTVFKGAVCYRRAGLKKIRLPGHGKLVAVKKVNVDLLPAAAASSSSSSSSSDAATVTALKAAAEKDIKKAISSEINVLKSFRSCPI